MLDNYEKMENGLIRQIKVNPFFGYGFNYSNKYTNLGELSIRMSHLRLGYLLGKMKSVPESLLDVGYGNGDFLKVASKIIPTCYGNDLTEEYPLPDGVHFTKSIFDRHYSVISMFDVLEHFSDVYVIKNLQCDYLYVSVPWCHYHSDEWFYAWKHRRPDEHIYHFNDLSLINFMNEVGYECMGLSNIEDCIRIPVDSDKNILTGIFRKK